MKKKKTPWYYIVLMLIQPLVFAGFFVLGAVLDGKLWENAEAAQGHPAPVFSLLLPILGAAICLIVFLIAAIGLIVCLRKRRKKQEAIGQEKEMTSQYCPRCGLPVHGSFCGNCGKKLED